jgi:RNA polymerase sigma factor (TIGR02999 family)
MSDVTCILERAERGDPQAAEELLPLVYEELRKLAAARMAREAAGQTLQPTALVHEAWLRLVGSEQQTWQNRSHFFAAAAEAMRRILIDKARRKLAQRRGAGASHVDVHELEISTPEGEDQLLAVHEALDRFAAKEPQKAELVKLRYFVGMKIEEAAEVLGISEATAKRWWVYARAWLFEDIRSATAGAGGKSARVDRPASPGK